MVAAGMTRPANPFATRWIRAGVVAPLDGHGAALPVATLADRVAAAGIVALVGPHGSGKSNLLAALATMLARRRPCVVLRVAPARGWLALAAVRGISRLPRGGIACIDGWERLGILARFAIRAVAWWRGTSLVVTCHRAAGLPILARCTTSPALLARIVAALPSHGGRITPADIDAAFVRHGGNLREALFDLYDRFEERVREAGGASVVPAVTATRVVADPAEEFTIASG
jgi:energy-coupling factor transporter ATP-binding protein EcfA2